MDLIYGSRLLTKLLSYVGLWPLQKSSGFVGILKSNLWLLHIPTTFLLTILMWFEVVYSTDIQHANEVLYIAITETAFVVKLLTNLYFNRTIHTILNNWETNESYVLKSRKEEIIWNRTQKIFSKIAIFYLISSFSVCAIQYYPIRFIKTSALPFPFWVPFEWKTNHWRWCVYSYNVITTIITCQSNTTLDLIPCYLMLHISLFFRVLGMRSSKLGYNANNADCKHELIDIIQLHQQIKRCTALCQKIISVPIFTQIVLSAFVICFSVYRLQYVNLHDEPDTFFATIQYALAMVMQILMPCYCAQKITEYSSGLTTALYNSNWPDMPRSTRKMILTFMQYVQKPVVMRAALFINIGLPIFTTTINNAYSLLALLLNIDK